MTITPVAPPTDSGSGQTEWAILRRLKKLYVDAGLIVAIVMGPTDPFCDTTLRFFKAAEEAGATLVVSYLTLMEAADVLRKRTKMHHRCRDESEEEREMANAAAAAAVARLVRFVNTRLALKQMVILEEVATVHVDFKRLFTKTLEHPGLTPMARRGNTYQHKGVGPVDLIHTDQAHLAKLPAMGTTDAAMVQLRDDALYGGIEIIVLRPESDADEGRQGGGGGVARIRPPSRPRSDPQGCELAAGF